MRAISTVLDASLCLLLVSASAVTLAETPVGDSGIGGATSATGPDTADETAELVATSTARVTYTPPAENAARTAHDTLAGLLASAIQVRTADRGNADFVRGVTARVNRTLRRHTAADLGVQVIANEAGNAPTSRIAAGATPQPGIDVHAANFRLRETRFTVRTWSA